MPIDFSIGGDDSRRAPDITFSVLSSFYISQRARSLVQRATTKGGAPIGEQKMNNFGII